MQRGSWILVGLALLGFLGLASDSLRAEQVTEVIDGVEWTTAKNLPAVASPHAKKGGEFRRQIPQFISTLRLLGPNARLATNSDIYGMTHETLLTLHSETHELTPVIASHWRISEDQRTFWYRIDPRARFSTGDPITAHDVVASFAALVDPTFQDPGYQKFYGDLYDLPVAEDHQTVRVHSKYLSFRGLLNFGIFVKIYPKKQISVPGAVYLDEYNWKQIAGSGPYHIEDYARDLKQEESITLTRRKDWWGAQLPENLGWYNFDKIHFIVVRDRNIAFEKLKAGELDYLKIMKSQRWVEECDFPGVQKGWVQKRKIYNEQPRSYAGYIFNMREWPFDDKNVRLAFCYAYNRQQLFDNFFFNEYEFLDSCYPGGEYENPKNRKIRYSKARAERLLDRAGYTQRNAEGIRVHEKTGKALEFEFEFGTPSFERLHIPMVGHMKDVGIKVSLKLTDFTALRKKVGERKFKMHYQSWRAPTLPNPLTQWNSALADQLDSSNYSGFKNERVDEIINEYRRCFDAARRAEIMREIDGIVCKEYTTCFSWYGPFERILYWNRFGVPETYLTRYTDDRVVMFLWWYDEAKAKTLEAAMANDQSLPQGKMLVDPWGAKARMANPPSEQ